MSPGDQLVHFAWPTTNPGYSCSYVLPVALNLLAEIAGGQKLTLLDIGCGNGFAAGKFSELGHRVTGVDVSPEGIDTARAAYRCIRFELGSVYDNELPSRLGTLFNCVAALEVIEHLQYPKMLFKRAFELLRPGGFLILSTPYYGYVKNLAIAIVNAWDRHHDVAYDVGHVKFFSNSTLGAMASAGGFVPLKFVGAGRLPWFWKSTVMLARKRDMVRQIG